MDAKKNGRLLKWEQEFKISISIYKPAFLPCRFQKA